MKTLIRRADLESDRLPLIGFLREFLTPLSDERRFDWLYRENPYGKALAWIAVNQKSGTIIGTAAAFPRPISGLGNQLIGHVLGDFCIHPHFRSIGPALALQRACVQELTSGSSSVGYDFPSEAMMAIYHRLGSVSSAQMIRMAKPLRVDRKIGEKVKLRGAARGLSSVGNRLLKWRDRVRRVNGVEQIGLHTAGFGVEFSELAARALAEDKVCVARTREYLNWRFLANPMQRFEMLTARRDTQLAAYVIFIQEGENARIVDLFGSDDSELLSRLVVESVNLLRERRVMTLSASVLASHSHGALLRRLGFYGRETYPVVFYYPQRTGIPDSRVRQSAWLLMDGDRDS